MRVLVPALLALVALGPAPPSPAPSPPARRDVDSTIRPGLYRSAGPPVRLARVIYARGGMVGYWAVTDAATADKPEGKVLQRMPLAQFRALKFAPVAPAPAPKPKAKTTPPGG